MTGTANLLHTGGSVALALVPAILVLANRSSPLVVGLAAALFLAGLLAERGVAAIPLLVRPLLHPAGLTALAFLAWCGLSIAWSPFPALSWRTMGEFLPTLAAAYLLVLLAPARLAPGTALLAAALLAAAALSVLASLALDLAPQRFLGQRVAYFVLNRPVLTFLLIAPPLAATLFVRSHRAVAVGLLVLSGAAVLRSVSGAAALGLLAGTAMALLAWLLPRRIALAIAGTGLAGALVLAPVEGDILHRFMPEAAHARLIQSSSRARVAIAQSFGAAVAADPWRGAGYGTAARFAEVPVAEGLAPEMRKMLAVGHPHNSFLQVWAELGIVGAILAAALLGFGLQALAGLSGARLTAALCLAAAASAVAFVEHGAWQAWWTAGLGAAITWLRASWQRTDPGDSGDAE